jgi:hypothetical protein
MSKKEQRQARNFHRTGELLMNDIAAELYAVRPRDKSPRTLPSTLPGCSVSADGEPIPENNRIPQAFEDGLYIAVCNHVARELQKYNTCNRRKSEANIDRLLTAMRFQEWLYNGESSVLPCSNTHILDRQHTLEAIIRYFEETDVDHVKRPFLMRIELGLPPEAFATYDNGAKRTLADTLHVEVANGNVSYSDVPDQLVSSSLRLLLQYLNNVHEIHADDINYLPNERAGLINSRAAELLKMYPQLVKSVEFVCSVKGLRTVVRPFIPAVAHMLITEAQSETSANNFIKSLASGSDLPDGSPILALRSLYLKALPKKRRMEGPEALAYFMHAWNKFAEGKDVAPGRLKSFGPDRKIPVPQKLSRQRSAV